MREVVIEVEFESAVCILRRDQCQEVTDAIWRRNGWGTSDFRNVGKETVEPLENLGCGVGGDVK